MTEIAFSPSFTRAFKKRIAKNKALEEKFWKKAEVFVKNPFDQSLKTHKLSGVLDEVWSFSVEYDCRILFYFLSQKRVVFIDIGSHAEVY